MNHPISHVQQDPKLITMDEREAAAIIGLTAKTLQHRRYMRQPPTFLKVGRKIRYRLSDLQDYLDACQVQPDRT
ncbi:helix-turn-helix domain-containing protein [Desulfovibrio intestinalis]|uniref:DNA-binding protein n=1 Tax=Desulfovibrio intestinalis TaxID=58621 RepID=A0A7W8C2I2_9BACT|nr:helix-turn-helix domain-containing protein [Desulfovibrio intestinalis]MBB5142515.1 hypothetical protein [Desulfovibrio intestinalis]